MEFTIGDKTFTATPVGFDLQLAAQRHLQVIRMVDFQRAMQACEQAKPELQRNIIEVAFERLGKLVSLMDVLVWIESPVGQVFQLWYVLSHKHPELTLDQVEAMMPNVTAQHMRDIESMVRVKLGLEVPNG